MHRIYLNGLLLGLAVLLAAAVSNSGGPPAAHSGAPGERTCAASGCHGRVVQGPGRLTVRLGNDLTEYSPGQTYRITVELVEPERNGRMGFQLTALDASNQRAGVLTISNDEVRTISGNVSGGLRQYAVQSSSGNRTTSPNTRVWTFNWTAPDAGTGEVTFYVAALGANGNGRSDSDDRTYTASLRIGEQASTPPVLTLGTLEESYCQGEEFGLNFTTSAPFNSGNQFTLELSDAAGSFTNLRVLGQVSGTTSGTINAAIPARQAAGNGYRFRLRASSPQVMSEPSVAFAVLESPEQPLIAREGNTLSVEAGFESYQWLRNGQPIAGANANSYAPNQDGIYSVRISNAEGCTATSEPFNFTMTSRQRAHSKADWTLYPNPATETVRLRGQCLQGATVYLYELRGRLILAQPLVLEDAEGRIDLQPLPRGAYQLQLRNASGQSLGSQPLLVR